MLDNNQFDEFFRNRLLDHSSPVNKGAWKSIHSQLGRAKAFHFWKWYLVGPVVVVIAVIAAHFVLSPAKKSPTATTPSSAETTASPAAITPSSAATPSSNSSTPGSAAATPAASPAATPAASSTATPAASPAAFPAASPATTPAISSAAGNAASRPSKTTASVSHKGSSLSNANPSLHLAASHTRSAGYASLGPAHNTMTGGHRTHHRTTHQTSESAAGAGLDTRTAGNSSISSTTPASGSPFAQSPNGAGDTRSGTGISTPHHLTKLSIVRLSTPPWITAKTPKPSPRALVPAPARTHHGLDLRLDAFGSPDFPNKWFGFSFTAGARVTLALNEHWSATTGVQFSRINADVQTDTQSLHPGYFNDLDLPVLVGYTFTSKNDFMFTARAGVIFSLYSQAHEQLAWYPFGSRRGPSAYLGFEISKPLNDRWAIFAEPYGRCLFSAINAYNPYPHQVFTEGLTLGIRYNFGK